MNTSSRFSRVSRRAFVTGSASLAAIVGLTACADDSALVASSSTADTPDSGATAPAPTATTPTSATPETSPAAAAGTLSVNFTVASGGKNPYIAIWVETTNGQYVQTISLWHLQGKDRWLSDLSAWYAASGGAETNSGATRAGGTYSVEWDLTDATGTPVPEGDYVLYLEGAREHGSYELLQSPITIGGKATSGTMEDSQDITGVTWSYAA